MNLNGPRWRRHRLAFELWRVGRTYPEIAKIIGARNGIPGSIRPQTAKVMVKRYRQLRDIWLWRNIGLNKRAANLQKPLHSRT